MIAEKRRRQLHRDKKKDNLPVTTITENLYRQ